VGVKLDLSFNGRMYCIRRVADNKWLTGMYECNRRMELNPSNNILRKVIQVGPMPRSRETLKCTQ
jgi:hypothetical protein